MNLLRLCRVASKPRWDGSRVLFDIEVAGVAVPCAISRAALGHVVGSASIATRDLLARFADGQGRVEQIAREILAERPPGARGTLSIWSDDITFDLPPSTPAAGWMPERMAMAG